MLHRCERGSQVESDLQVAARKPEPMLEIAQTRVHSTQLNTLFLHPTTSSTIAPSVNTGTVKANVATMNLETNDSIISKFLCGTFSDGRIHLFPAAGGDVLSKNTVINNNITSASRKHKIILTRFA